MPDLLDLEEVSADVFTGPNEEDRGHGRLFGYRYDGFWKPADTFKERAELEDRYHSGERPWMLWEHVADESTIGAATASR